MLTTVKGTYHDGLVELSEPAPATGTAARPVLVVFLEPEAAPATLAPPAKPRFSWDKALALPTTPGTSVSDAVIEEREEYR